MSLTVVIPARNEKVILLVLLAARAAVSQIASASTEPSFTTAKGY
jgi:hypothetical protein